MTGLGNRAHSPAGEWLYASRRRAPAVSLIPYIPSLWKVMGTGPPTALPADRQGPDEGYARLRKKKRCIEYFLSDSFFGKNSFAGEKIRKNNL